MAKRTVFSFAIILMILITSCDLFPAGTPQATPTGFNEDEIATIVALSTQVNKPTDEVPQLPSITSTPGVYGQGGEVAGRTPLPGSIKLTGIKEKSSSTALVTWEASGDFPSGFKIVWTDEQGNPTYPNDSSISAVSSTARSAAFSVTPNKIYYVRVCRFLYDKCDIYSDLGIFAFAPPTATPRPTKTLIPGGGGSGGTVVPYDPTLVITLMKGGETGKAYMAWTDKSTSSKGYMIVYSKTSTVPTFGTDSKFYVSDPNARFAYVDGKSNTKYYYRICRYTGSTCGSYSAVFTYTFPSVHTPTPDGSVITITDITDTGLGEAEISWTATGDFPNGFKILSSKTNVLPTLSDNVVVVSNSASRVGTITGVPGDTYHVRICKYSGSACVAYSSVVDFTFLDDPATITITGLVDNATSGGDIDLEWEATGSFPDGFLILFTPYESVPTYTNASAETVASGAARSSTLSTIGDMRFYLRICKNTGSGCGVYSNIVEFTTAEGGIVLSNSGDLDVYDWALTPDDDHTDGYHLFWIQDTITPVWEAGLDQQAAVAADRSITLSSSLTTGHYILRLCTWDAAQSECSAYSNTLEVDVP